LHEFKLLHGLGFNFKPTAQLPLKRTARAILAVIATVGLVYGRVLNVPSEYHSIQAALDSVLEGDTVFIARGLYAETLLAPNTSFSLVGEFNEGGGDSARPFLSSSGIGQSDTVAGLWLPRFCAIRIENILIRNENRFGIRSYADSVVMLNCVIDNVRYGLREMADSIESYVRLEHCDFSSCQMSCVFTALGGYLCATGCQFHGVEESLPLINGQDMWLDSCAFESEPGRAMVFGFNGRVTISNCEFAENNISASGGISAVQLIGPLRKELLRNRFARHRYLAHVVEVSCGQCDSLSFSENVFEDCIPQADAISAQGAVLIICESAQMGTTIERNQFHGCAGGSGVDDIFAPVLLTNSLATNLFDHDSVNSLPSVYAGNPSWQPTPLTLINNRWENCGYAVDLSAAADARDNYWGHNSGPYHAEFNPDGQGDTITGNVPFIPWLIDSTDAADDPVIVPNDFALVAYPNPFNAVTTLQYTLAQRSHVSLKVFDLLGREVATIVNDIREAGTHEVEFDGAALASSIYFARLETPQASRVTRLLLLK